jgi:hypothetical protein
LPGTSVHRIEGEIWLPVPLENKHERCFKKKKKEGNILVKGIKDILMGLGNWLPGNGLIV